MFDQFFIELQRVAHPYRAVSGIREHPERHIGHAEGGETLFRAEGCADLLREVGPEQRRDFRGIFFRDDDHAQFGPGFVGDLLQAFERGDAGGVRGVEKLDVGRRSGRRLVVVEPFRDFELGDPVAEHDVLGHGATRSRDGCERQDKEHFLHREPCFVIRRHEK